MCAHEVDELRCPVDLELRRLEMHLCDLAGTWAGNWGNPDRQAEIVREYHATITKLYALGWDDTIDLQCVLPRELMPEEYTRRNPGPSFDIWQWPRKT
jgi:hypothetical protein